jgi:hypothetical protein
VTPEKWSEMVTKTEAKSTELPYLIAKENNFVQHFLGLSMIFSELFHPRRSGYGEITKS